MGIKIFGSRTSLYTPQQVQIEKDRIISAFGEFQSEFGNVVSLYWQLNADIHDGFTQDTLEVLSGSPYIYQQLQINNDLFKFRISPLSFFQSNIGACQELYSLVSNWIQTPMKVKNPSRKKKIILDLCCGTGTIGIALSRIPGVVKVHGIEMCESAVEDAEFNAELNYIDNISFICSKVERSNIFYLGPK